MFVFKYVCFQINFLTIWLRHTSHLNKCQHFWNKFPPLGFWHSFGIVAFVLIFDFFEGVRHDLKKHNDFIASFYFGFKLDKSRLTLLPSAFSVWGFGVFSWARLRKRGLSSRDSVSNSGMSLSWTSWLRYTSMTISLKKINL